MKPGAFFLTRTLNHEDLESTFVARQPLLSTVFRSLKFAALNDNAKVDYLLKGRRGIGKTHFISLLFHRLSDDVEITSKCNVVWLREEEWGMDSYLRLHIVIIQKLFEQNSAKASELLDDIYDAFEKSGTIVAEKVAEGTLRSLMGKKKLILLVENIEIYATGLKKGGQKKLRENLMSCGSVYIVATSPYSIDALDEGKPFYNYFEEVWLEPFTEKESLQYFITLAKVKKDKRSIEFLGKDIGKERVKAIHRLFAGVPRYYSLFYRHCQTQWADDLAKYIIELLDILTPFFQDIMGSVPNQQRKILDYLARERKAVQIKEIARTLTMTQGNASRQCSLLEHTGYVTIHSGHGTFCEVKDVLLRMWLNLGLRCSESTCPPPNEQSREEIKLIVEFLQNWYTDEKIRLILFSAKSKDSFRHSLLMSLVELIDDENERFVLEEALHTNALKKLIQGKTSKITPGLIPIECISRFFTDDPSNFENGIREKIKLLKRQKKNELLKSSISKSFPVLLKSDASDRRKEAWRNAWVNIGKEFPELNLYAQAIDVAIRFNKGENKRILCELPQEIRGLIKDLME